MPVYFSSAAFPGLAPEDILRELQSVPGVGLELTAGLHPRSDWRKCLSSWRATGVPLLIHNYFPPPAKPFVLNLASPDPAIHMASLALCHEALRLTAEAGAPFYSVHAGFAMNLRPEQLGDHTAQARELDKLDPATAEETFSASIFELAEKARSLGVRLLIENNVVSEPHRRSGLDQALLLSAPASIQRAFARWTHLPVGLLLDVGHAKVTATTLGFDAEDFFELDHIIEALHLSDNDGLADSNQAFGPDAWFADHVPAFVNIPIVLEVYGLDAPARFQQWKILSSLLRP